MSGGQGTRAGRLGRDDVIRYADTDHFLDELAGNLGQGRAYVRSDREIPVGARLRVGVEAPAGAGRIAFEAEVVYARDGYLGLELHDFDERLEALDVLGQRAESNRASRSVGSMGAAEVRIADDDDAVTGRLEMPPSLADLERAPTPVVETPEAGARGQGAGSSGAVPTPDRPAPVDRRAQGPHPDELTAALSAYVSERPDPTSEPGHSTDRPGTDPSASGRAPEADAPAPPPARTLRARDDTVLAPPPEDGLRETAPREVVPRPERDPDRQRGADRSPRRGPTPGRLPPAETTVAGSPPPIAERSRPEERSDQNGETGAKARAAPDEREARPRQGLESERPRPGEGARTSASKGTAEGAAGEAGGLPAFGVEHLDNAPFARMSPAGAVRVSDAGALLGLWLSGLDRGHLTVLGGPETEPGATVQAKLIAGRVVTVDAVVRTRVGPWLTLEIADREPIADLLREARSDWAKALERLGLPASTGSPSPGPRNSGAVVVPPPPTGDLVEPTDGGERRVGASTVDLLRATGDQWRSTGELTPVPGDRPRSPDDALRATDDVLRATGDGLRATGDLPTTDRAGQPLSRPGLAVGPSSSFGAGPTVRLPEPEDPSAPAEPPRLEGERVLFRHAGDLRRELEVDLASGGLSVIAPPLPLRAKKRLRLVVGTVELPVRAEADVVYADKGRVGFSIVGAAELVKALERILAEGVRPGEGAPTSSPSVPTSSPRTDPGPVAIELRGSLSQPPSIEGLTELEVHRTGDLERIESSSAVGLFHELVQKRFKGVLELQAEGGLRRAYLHDGNVAFLEADPFEEATALGHLLTHHKRLTESALRDGLAKAKRAQKPLGRTLVALGLARSSDVISALREQTRSRLEAAFSWRSGWFQLGGWREPPGRGDLIVTRGLGILAHHLRHRFGQLGLGELERLLAHRLRVGARPTPSLERTATALGLPPKELRFLQVSLEGRSLEEAARLSPLGKLASLRLAALAFGLGLIEPEATVGRAERVVSRGEDRAARMRRELRARLDHLQGQNHFEVLGLHWSSHHRTFRAAYEALLGELSTVRGPYQDAPADVQALARKCVQRVKEAFEVLSDDSRRTSYRKELFDQTEREYSAQMLVQKGELALIRGDRVAAIEHLETAVELAPTDRNRSLLRAAREGRN